MHLFIQNIATGLPLLVLLALIAALLYMLGKGADILVDEAISLSVKWNIPKMLIGATIVSLGTTFPEAAVSVTAAVKGEPDLALGNAVSSIICDTGLIAPVHFFELLFPAMLLVLVVFRIGIGFLTFRLFFNRL